MTELKCIKVYVSNVHAISFKYCFCYFQASLCDPQLQEGDEIVYINGRQAEQLSHEQVTVEHRC